MHLLVRAYLGYEPPARTSAPADADEDDAGFAPWMNQSMSAVPGPQILADATQEEALDAFERLFFGEVKDVQQL